MMIVLFWQAPVKQKVAVLLAGALVFAAAVLFLPEYLRVRYLTVFSADTSTMSQLDERHREFMGETSARRRDGCNYFGIHWR